MPRRVSRQVLRQLREERLVREAEEQAQQDEKTQQPVEEYPPVEPMRAASHAGIVEQRPTAGQEAQAALRDYECNQSEKHLPCPQCGTYTQPGTKFCPNCGYNMAPSQAEAAGYQEGGQEQRTETRHATLGRNQILAVVLVSIGVMLIGLVYISNATKSRRMKRIVDEELALAQKIDHLRIGTPIEQVALELGPPRRVQQFTSGQPNPWGIDTSQQIEIWYYGRARQHQLVFKEQMVGSGVTYQPNGLARIGQWDLVLVAVNQY